MRLEKCYALPPKLFGPQEDFYPDPKNLPNLYYTWRLFSCNCGKITGWRLWHEEASHFVCSTECLELLIKGVITPPALPVPAPVPVAVVVVEPVVVVAPEPVVVAAIEVSSDPNPNIGWTDVPVIVVKEEPSPG